MNDMYDDFWIHKLPMNSLLFTTKNLPGFVSRQNSNSSRHVYDRWGEQTDSPTFQRGNGLQAVIKVELFLFEDQKYYPPWPPKTYLFRVVLWYITWFLGGQKLFFSWFWGLMAVIWNATQLYVDYNNWVAVWNMFCVHPENWGNDPIWRIFFQIGWNHHLLVDNLLSQWPGSLSRDFTTSAVRSPAHTIRGTGIFTYMWFISFVNVGEYTIFHGCE